MASYMGALILGLIFYFFSQISGVSYAVYFFGISAILVYLVIYHKQYCSWVEGGVTKFKELGEDQKACKKSFSDNLGGREGSMLQMGTIFIAATFILLGIAFQKRIDPSVKLLVAVSAPVVYSWWLLSIQLTTRLMGDTEAQILVEMGDGPMVLKRKIYGEKDGYSLLMKIRRNHWLFYLLVITLISVYILK